MLFLFAFLAFSNIKYVKESLAEEEAPSTAEQIFTTFYKENDETDPPTTYQPQGGGNEETEPQTTYQPQSGGNEDPDPPTTYDQGGDVSPPTESDVLDIEYFVTILPQILGDGISYSEFYKLFPDLAETLADHKLMKGIFDFISKEDFTLNEFYNKTMENLGIKEYDGILENSTELLEKLFKYSDPSTKLADLFKLKDKELLDSLDKVNEVYKLLGEKVFEFLNIQNKETWEKRFTDFVSNYQKATLKEVVQHLNLKPELLDAIHNVFGFMYDKKDFKDFIDPVRKQIKYDDFKKSVLTLNDFEKKPLSMINLLKVLTSAVGFTNDALQYLIDQFHGLLTETFDDVVFSFLDIFERAIGTRAQTLVDILKIIQTIKPDENDPKKEYLVAIREFVNRMGSPFCQDQKCDGIEQLIETVTLFTKPVNVTEVLTSQKQFPVETIMTIVETVQAISSPDLNWGNLFVQLRHLPNVNLGPINSTTLIDCVITAISFVGWEVPEEGKAHVLASVDLIQIAKDLDVYNYLEMVFEFVREFKESPMREFSYLSEYSDLLETIEKLISKISKAVAQTSETPIMELLGSYNETVLTACKFLQHLDEPIISLIQKALKELGFPDTEKLKNIKEIVQELIKLCKEFQELFNYLISLIPYSDLMMSQYEAIMNKFWGLWVDLEKTTLASIADQMYNGVGAVLENLASASEVISKEGAKVIEIVSSVDSNFLNVLTTCQKLAKEENISFYLLFTSISSGSQTKQALLISARYARENTKPSTKSIEDLIPFNKIGNILGGFADASRKDKITKEILTVTMKFAQNELQEDFDVILKFLKEHPVVTLAKVINLSSSDVELIEKIREYTHYIATCIVESDLFDPKYPNSAIKTKTPEPPIISETPGEVVPTQTNDGKPVEKPEEPPGANEVESSSKDFDFSNPDTIKGDKDSITVDKNKDVNVITVKDKEVTVKGTSTKKPESEVYIQPTQENTKITIEGKSDKDFGEAEFGVKTSDKVKTTTIVVNSNKVPLNLFTENTKEAPSSINIEVPKDTTEISLKKVTISNGQLQINIPVSVTLASFVEAVFYSVTNFMVSSSGGADKALLLADNIKTQIDVVDLKGGSETTLNNAHVTKKLTINSNAFVKFIGPSSINGDVSIRFDEKVLLNGKEIISLDDASAYEGVPNSIKVERIGVPLDEYEEARLVCGKSFSVCNDWAAKITEFPANYSAAVCKDVDGRQCLVLEPQSDEGSKGGLAPGAIAGIVIAVIVVIVIVIVVVIIMRRKRGSSSSSKSVSSSSSS